MQQVYKNVNISVSGRPITALRVPIRGDIKNVRLSVNEIRDVILQHGIVDEILPDGSLVRLNLMNYAKTDAYENLMKKREMDKRAKEQKRLEEERQQAIIEMKKKALEEAKHPQPKVEEPRLSKAERRAKRREQMMQKVEPVANETLETEVESEEETAKVEQLTDKV